jgi:hypothetical protein
LNQSANKIILYLGKITWTLTKRDGKQLNVFERKVYRRILGPVYDSEKENWRILTNKEIYASVKKPTIIETIRLNRLRWFGHVQRMETLTKRRRSKYISNGIVIVAIIIIIIVIIIINTCTHAHTCSRCILIALHNLLYNSYVC